jgi:rare lipoprotein A (peptidoglycan hydrolase)
MKRISVALVAGLFITALCAAQGYPGADTANFRQEGIASWYGTEFDGRPTASGEVFNSTQYTAAPPTRPIGTQLNVTNQNNRRKVNVRVNDRGPFVSSRIIDLSQAAAAMLDMVAAGTAPVLVESMGRETGQAASQGNNYQAETTAQARSEGGYSNANSQIVAPSYPAPQPAYQQPPTYPQQPAYAPQAAEPVVVQVQPPQQQITQYFQQPPQQQVQQQPSPQPQYPQQQYQQPPQQVQPQYPQQGMQYQQPPQQVQPQYQQQPYQQPQYQSAPQQTPAARQQPPVQQQILPVQQVIQPMQPMVAAPAAPAPQAAAPTPTQPVVTATPQQLQPLQINIPIEVRPVVTETAAPSAAPASPYAAPIPPAAAAPVAAPAPYAAPTSAPEAPAPVTPTVAPIPPAPVAAAPAPVSAPPAIPTTAVQPNKVYRVQVGSYKVARNALSAFERLKNAGLNPLYERNGDDFRVVLTGSPSEEVNGVMQKLGSAGFNDPLLREER